MKILVLIGAILICYGIMLFLPLGLAFGLQGDNSFESGLVEELLRNSLITIFSALLIRYLKLVKVCGIKNFIPKTSSHVLLIPGYLVLIGVLQIKGLDFSNARSESIILLLFTTLSIGFSEELVFRGLLQSLFLQVFLRKNSTKMAVLLSIVLPSCLFGLFHLLNFSVEYAAAEVAQFFYSTFIGIGFGAILLRTNSLIPLAIIHGLIDFVFNIDEIVSQDSVGSYVILNAIISAIVVLPILIAGILIIRKIRPSQIVIE